MPGLITRQRPLPWLLGSSISTEPMAMALLNVVLLGILRGQQLVRRGLVHGSQTTAIRCSGGRTAALRQDVEANFAGELSGVGAAPSSNGGTSSTPGAAGAGVDASPDGAAEVSGTLTFYFVDSEGGQSTVVPSR